MQLTLDSDNPSHQPALWAYAQTLAQSTELGASERGKALQQLLLSIGYDPHPTPDLTLIDGCHAMLPPSGREVYDNGQHIARFIHDLPAGWTFDWGHDGRQPVWHRHEGPELMPKAIRDADPNRYHALTIYQHVGWDDLGRDEPSYQWFAHRGGHQTGMETGMADTPKEAIEAALAWFAQFGNRPPDEEPAP